MLTPRRLSGKPNVKEKARNKEKAVKFPTHSSHQLCCISRNLMCVKSGSLRRPNLMKITFPLYRQSEEKKINTTLTLVGCYCKYARICDLGFESFKNPKSRAFTDFHFFTT